MFEVAIDTQEPYEKKSKEIFTIDQNGGYLSAAEKGRDWEVTGDGCWQRPTVLTCEGVNVDFLF